MSQLPLQKSPTTLNSLQPCPSFGKPIGERPKQTDCSFYEKDGIIMGTWECEPGKLALDLKVTEFCHLLKGKWVLTAESGAVTTVEAGDSFAFPKGWRGTCRVVETVRKVYTIIE